jgi:pimeloyl-ACP methyl ester carboxylesterase
MAFFRDEKSSLHYLVRGYGEPLLLIHGLGGSGVDWAFQVAALEKRFRVIVPDLPGSGHSPPPRDEYTIDGFATTLCCSPTNRCRRRHAGSATLPLPRRRLRSPEASPKSTRWRA